MCAQQQDAIELEDFGDATAETRQYWISIEYPDNVFGRGPYPGWLKIAAERGEDLAAF